MGTKLSIHTLGKRSHRQFAKFLKQGLLICAILSCLLPQPLLAALTTNEVVDGVLTVTSDADDDITITCALDNVQVNGADPDNGAALCNSITDIVVTGGPGENTIDLNTINTPEFTTTVTVTVDGAGANDVITGTFYADTLNGGEGDDRVIGHRGADTMNGDSGDDTLVWNNGDGSDVAEGGEGNDTVEVNGQVAGETFTISSTLTGAIISRTNPGPFSVTIISPTENLLLNTFGGDDIVTGTTGLRNVITLTVNAGEDNDLVRGGDGPDTLNGDAGDDTLIGFRAADTMNGGSGDDTMVWNNGDGSDIADGGEGNDTVEVNGQVAAETFTISSTVTGAIISRTNPGPFSVTIISPTENLRLNTFEGNDIVTGTSGLNRVITITVNGGDDDDLMRGSDGPDTLNGEAGNDTITGFRGADAMNGGPGDDTMIWNNGDGSDIADGDEGNDTVVVNGQVAAETFTISSTVSGAIISRTNPGPFSVTIISPTENLLLNTFEGNDIVTGTRDLSGVITMTVNGGDDDDLIKGGDGADTLNGDAGNDELIGFVGPDTMNGGAGDDTMVWNNGDGSDVMDGGEGDDTVVVNGNTVSETFAISPTSTALAAGVNAPLVGSVFFQRVAPGPFNLDIEAERVEVNGNEGDDTFNVTPLDYTEVHYDGGPLLADILRVNALGREVNQTAGSVLVTGKAPITHENVEVVDIVNQDDQFLLYLPLIRKWTPPNAAR